jgi:predicted metal-dependent hydrolase
MDYEFGQFTPEHLKKMKEGVELFNEQKYWECHEALEDVWMEDRNDNARNVYWAVIQVAAACIHYRDNKIIGSQGMIMKAKQKFKRCRDMHILTDLAFKYLDWEELERIVLRIPDGELSQLEDFKELFAFRFKNYPEGGEI